MKNENITPAQFVEKWLPDFTRRYANLQNQCQTHSNAICAADRREWYEEVFPEALATFEAHIRQETISEIAERMSDHGIDMNSKWARRLWQQACEAQRIECAKAYMSPECESYVDDEEAERMILNAPIPEIPKNDEK